MSLIKALETALFVSSLLTFFVMILYWYSLFDSLA